MSKKASNDIVWRAIKTFLQTFISMLIVTPIMVGGKFDTQALYSLLVATLAACVSGGQNYGIIKLQERQQPDE